MGLVVLCWLVPFLLSPHGSAALTAAPGEDVTLTCEEPGSFITAHCRRTEDLEEDYVFVFTNEDISHKDMRPDFRHRVVPQTKDGKMCFILKNVTSGDNGTYECQALLHGSKWKEPIRTFKLNVLSPGTNSGAREDGSSIPVWVPIVATVVGLCLVVALVVYRFRNSC